MTKRLSLYKKRILKNRVAIACASLTILISLFFLSWIVWTLIMRGSISFNVQMFTQMTPPPGSKGGLLNAITGSFIMVLIAMIAGTIIGLCVATYFSEYGRSNMFTRVTRFINDVLLSSPSILLGLFVYEVYVAPLGHFSGWAGAIVLSILAVPIILRSSDSVFALVPKELREAAIGLGVPIWKIVLRIILPLSKTGLIAGCVLALARVSGETAPLLFTSLNNQFWSTDMARPLASLPVVIYQYAMSPYQDWKDLAWSGALFLTIFIFFLNICVRLISSAQPKH